MTNYFFKKLAQSVVDGKIQKKEALKIISLLSTSQLRGLLGQMKLADEKNTLEAIVADEPSLSLRKSLSSKFPNSKIIINVDKKIGAGIKVRKFDMIYDFTVKSRIRNVIDNLGKEM